MLTFLTKPCGRFPLGIWIALALLSVGGLVVGVGGQALSLWNWDAALALGLQEDHRNNSSDTLERAIAAVSWGEAAADVLVQGPLILVSLIGIWRQRSYGYVACITTAILWIYVTLLLSLERIGLYRQGLTPDLSRYWSVGLPMALLVGIPGVVLLICLVANQDFFGSKDMTKKML